MVEHPSVEVLADDAEGLLPPEQASAVAAHVVDCAWCREQVNALTEVSTLLANEPLPPVPAEVTSRLAAAVSAEQARRAAGVTVLDRHPDRVGGWSSRPRVSLGDFGVDRARPNHGRWVVPALAAAAASVLVGFGGYVLSARAGLNDPPVVAAVSSAALGTDAGALERRIDLDPHRFTRAWQCARQVTSGRITGIAATTVDGVPALLVYVKSGGVTQVTLVTGCNDDEPSAGPSAVLDR